MAVASQTKVVPLISSGTAGPLGAVHLPRLWSKLTLAAAGLLPEGYDECGQGFDQLTISDLGLNKDEVITYVRTRKPTYVEFEEFVRTKGKTDADTIKKHNAAVLGYNHADDKAESGPGHQLDGSDCDRGGIPFQSGAEERRHGLGLGWQLLGRIGKRYSLHVRLRLCADTGASSGSRQCNRDRRRRIVFSGPEIG